MVCKTASGVPSRQAHLYSRFLVFTDYCIYWIHRWEHHPICYKWLHKPHHKWLSTSRLNISPHFYIQTFSLFSSPYTCTQPRLLIFPSDSSHSLRLPRLPPARRIPPVHPLPPIHLPLPTAPETLSGPVLRSQLLEYLRKFTISQAPPPLVMSPPLTQLGRYRSTTRT